MGDRQDIDALLIGAVYGELDAAEKARLEDHLAAHPADRAAMDALAATRSRVRADLARMPEADPAPAISTLLLQEAARRAPRQSKGGVLAWVAGLFTPIARHPAMAGALALALIGGAATVLHERGKVSSEEHAVATDTPAAAAKPDVAELDKHVDEKKTETEGYEVKLAEPQRAQETSLDRDGAGDVPPTETNARGEVAAKDTNDASRQAAAHHAGAPSKNAKQGSGYLEVTTPERKPKQLDDQVAQGFSAGLSGGGGGGAIGGAPGNAPAGPATGAGATASGDNVAAAAQPAPRATATAPAYNQAQDAKLTEWAQVQHQRLVQLVKAGNCTEAGRIGSEIAARAPEYYAANIENDRAVKSCKQYIDQEKRKKANEQYKSRARNSYEPDMPSPTAN